MGDTVSSGSSVAWRNVADAATTMLVSDCNSCREIGRRQAPPAPPLRLDLHVTAWLKSLSASWHAPCIAHSRRFACLRSCIATNGRNH